MGMTVETIESELAKLKNLSDDPEERIYTAGMQLQVAAFQEALETKLQSSK